MTGEGGFRDDPAAPHGFDQVILGHHALAVPQQVHQQVEDLRPDRDRVGPADQFPPIRIEDVVLEDKSNPRVSIHTVSPQVIDKGRIPSERGDLRDLGTRYYRHRGRFWT